MGDILPDPEDLYILAGGSNMSVTWYLAQCSGGVELLSEYAGDARLQTWIHGVKWTAYVTKNTAESNRRKLAVAEGRIEILEKKVDELRHNDD